MNKMNGNKILKEAYEDIKSIVLSYYMNKVKLFFILKRFKDIQVDLTNMSKATISADFVNEKDNIDLRRAWKIDKNDDIFTLKFDEKTGNYFEKQTFSDLYIMTGISCFEKYCKDWFILGLKYCPNRLNFFSKKQISVYELIKSKDIKENLINKIVDDINFQNTEICSNKFKDVFGFEIFETIDEKYKFEKYVNHRHIISHNLGYIDKSYIEKTKLDDLLSGQLILDDLLSGQLIFLREDELQDFEGRLDNIIERIATNIGEIIHLELKKY
ncbi:MAG: hypothetical protein OIN86_16805 [Candidatus Methanoperedens sp.]|nr:hypothetical protein [Candidatus Methanoperedens sp.]CAG0979356.1 hypothetical protein METP1_01684 [Methanosarcinales archaeon]